jgi:hypothetical protein
MQNAPARWRIVNPAEAARAVRSSYTVSSPDLMSGDPSCFEDLMDARVFTLEDSGWRLSPGHDERKLSENAPKRITAVDNAMTLT